VKLPHGQDRSEWLAINTVDFFNQINLLYGCISEFCTNESCPIMSAGKKYEYLLWAESSKNSKPSTCSAPEYVNKLLEWIGTCHLLNANPLIEQQLDNEALFPSSGNFPANFESTVIKTIFKRMFRVYSHIYYSHMEKIENIGEDAHLNTCFKHFIYFVKEFDLVDEQEQKPLANVIEQIMAGRR
jgi:MOB kinase activator 1